MRAWVNGRLLTDPTAPVVTVTDHGLTVGDGVFEAIKVVDGVPFALSRHLRRLARSAASLGLPDPDEELIRTGVEAVLDCEQLPLGRLRITWTAGPAPMGSGRVDGTPTLVVAAAAMDSAPESTTVITVPWPRNERGALAGIKTTSYAENVVALAAAARAGASEAIFANTVGNLCEGTGTNVGYVIEGEIRTPTLAAGCLAGITRELLLEWADVVEADEPIGVLAEADEVFLLSTTRDVQAVSRCDDRQLAAPGPRTRELMALWATREAERSDP